MQNETMYRGGQLRRGGRSGAAVGRTRRQGLWREGLGVATRRAPPREPLVHAFPFCKRPCCREGTPGGEPSAGRLAAPAYRDGDTDFKTASPAAKLPRPCPVSPSAPPPTT